MFLEYPTELLSSTDYSSVDNEHDVLVKTCPGYTSRITWKIYLHKLAILKI
jgi:hypothetical protein